MSSLFVQTLQRNNHSRPPVWLMRQAGRYHSHYQALRKKHSFMELCKIPEIACEVTMGPIREFNFDAAILFSDLLFPLEVMGMGLQYTPGPKLDWHLRSPADLSRLAGGRELAPQLQFQGDAMHLIRKELPQGKGLLGFVGGPLTLFYYAVEGSHQGQDLSSAYQGLSDGRWMGFNEKLIDLLAENMAIQVRGGADTIAVLDTCAGELNSNDFKTWVIPSLRKLLTRFHALCPGFPIVYYSKGTNPDHWRHLEGLAITGLGVDWHTPITEVLTEFGKTYAIQGNIDPNWLLLPKAEAETKIRAVFESVNALPQDLLNGWICGLGHGVLQHTPEENVHLFMQLNREYFGNRREVDAGEE